MIANIVEQSVQLLVSESDDPNDEEALRYSPCVRACAYLHLCSRISSGDALIIDGLYFGQSRTISGALVNSGPQSSSFSVSIGLADDASEQEEKEERTERQLGLVVLNANPYLSCLVNSQGLKKYLIHIGRKELWNLFRGKRYKLGLLPTFWILEGFSPGIIGITTGK